MSSAEKKLQQVLAQAVKSIYSAEIQPQIIRTKQKDHGDYASNIAFVLAKHLHHPPKGIAQTLAEHLAPVSWLKQIDIAGPGFINFFLADETKVSVIKKIQQSKQLITPTSNPKKIIIEFVSANPTGPLHVGHGRAAALGSTLANLYQAYGHQVHREYYVNDAGNQINILSLSVLLRYYALHSTFNILPYGCYQGDYINGIAKKIPSQKIPVQPEKFMNWLADQPPEIHTAIHSKDEHDMTIECLRAMVLWMQEEISQYPWLKNHAYSTILDGIRQDLIDFNVHFDSFFHESSLVPEAVDKALQRLDSQNLTEKRDGALWFKASQVGDEKDRVLIKANGECTYFATDLAYHWHKSQRADIMQDLFGADHHGYCARIKAGVNALATETPLDIRIYQFVTLLREGEKVGMSTRSGQFETVRDIYEFCGVDAARFFYTMRSGDQHLDFDLDLAKSASQDNPVYYIQYAHARICRILSKDNLKPEPDLSNLTDENELLLCHHLEQYQKIITRCIELNDPQPLSNYLLELAKKFHRYYNHIHVLKAPEPIKHARLSLLDAVRLVIADGLKILGISAPGSM